MNRRNEYYGQSRDNGNYAQQPERYPQQEWSDDDYRGGNRYRVDRPYASGEDQFEQGQQRGSRYQAGERSPSYGDYETEREISQSRGSYYGGSRSGQDRGQQSGWQGGGSQGGYGGYSGGETSMQRYGGSQAGYGQLRGYSSSQDHGPSPGGNYGRGGSGSMGYNYAGSGQRSYGGEYGAGSQSGRAGYPSIEDRNLNYGSRDYGRDFGPSREFGQGYGGAGYGQQRGGRGYGSDFSQSSGYDPGSYDRDAPTGSWGQSRSDFNQSGGYGSGYSQVGNRSGGQQQRGFSGRGPKGYTRSDERLREDINERLTDDYAIDAGDISVEVRNGTVTLTGSVDERWMKHHVEDLVDRCSGVQDIENRLTVRRNASAGSGTSGSPLGTGSSGTPGSGTQGLSSSATAGTGSTASSTSTRKQ
jgi:osmotically-inducible protein OsmY